MTGNLRTHRLFSLVPMHGRKLRSARELSLPATICIAGLFCAAAAIAAPAQNILFTSLASFDGADGLAPEASLIQANDGNFYGTTVLGGNHNSNCEYGCGTIFKITAEGAVTTLYSFCSQANCSDGADPQGWLMQANDGNFYGTTWNGGNACGIQGCGTVFKITPEGTLTTLYRFNPVANRSDGSNPYAGLVQGTDGNFYGTTEVGGVYGYGTIFQITPAGALTTLYGFNGTDGEQLYAGVVQGSDGNFYGTTYMGGAYGECLGLFGDGTCGTVFKLTPTGALTTLYNFCSQWNCADGSQPWGGLVQGSDGNFYGTTQYGGTSGGTVFKITPSGTLTTLYSFGGTDGVEPVAGLVQGGNANLYGTTFYGGAHGSGTAFEITPAGALTTLYSFCSLPDCRDGAHVAAGLVQATNGFFYGTTESGGSNDDGTVFRVGVVRTCATCRP